MGTSGNFTNILESVGTTATIIVEQYCRLFLSSLLMTLFIDIMIHKYHSNGCIFVLYLVVVFLSHSYIQTYIYIGDQELLITMCFTNRNLWLRGQHPQQYFSSYFFQAGIMAICEEENALDVRK